MVRRARRPQSSVRAKKLKALIAVLAVPLAPASPLPFPSPLAAGVAFAQESGPLGQVRSYEGSPFLYEGTYNLAAGFKRRRSENAIYNGKRTRVLRLEASLPMYAGDAILTPGDSSLEIDLAGEHWLVHPESRVEIRAAPRGFLVRDGRVTLLAPAALATGSVLVVEAGGESFEALGAGSYVVVDSQTGKARLGSDLRAQEFDGFDAFAVVRPVPPDTAGALPVADGGPLADGTGAPATVPAGATTTASEGTPANASTLTPPREAIPRDENPLDDAEEEAPVGTPSAAAATQPPSSQARSGAAVEMARVQLAYGHVFDTAGDSVAKKVWGLHAGALAWFHPNVAADLTFDLLPRVEARRDGARVAHQRWNLILGPRLSASPGTPVRWYVTPLFGVYRFAGRFEVGTARDGRKVYSELELGPSILYGIAPGFEISAIQRTLLSLQGLAAFRYSADRVVVRMLSLEGQGRVFLGDERGPARPYAFAFARYEDFRTEKPLLKFGTQEVYTGWSVLGVGLGASF